MELDEQLKKELMPIHEWAIKNNISKEEFGKLIDLIYFNINQAIERCREIAKEAQQNNTNVREN